ncbi:hypothetical protein IFM12275_25130 [Nocardia sputorum]|uniref:Uncharacterized protein n=2 Tax=Nocardiaceae TaxID=85025 RepID=A0ABM8D1A7_9NOCA|nr:hypothetical protein [Nocardia sputorum]BDT92537.1 hypothetical protein IFM12275_25130 [Nocardia sputorum]BDU01106.1 hypothetical protein IFM12276_41340 [Nocardia sputorum]
MNPMDPRDQHTARYEPGYQPGNYRDPGYNRDRGYEQDSGYSPEPGYGQDLRYSQDSGYGHGSGYGPDHGYSAYESDRPARRSRPQQGPDVNVGMFVGGVIAAAVVTALAAWLCAWIIEIIATRVTESGEFGVWSPMSQDAYWFAVVAFICALLAGVLWYLLRLGTPSPELFFGWIVGILTAAAVIIPLALSSHLWVGISTGIEHLVIGLPIFSLVRMVGAKSTVSAVEHGRPGSSRGA